VDVERLQQQNQTNLIEFLHIELEIAATLLEMARTTRNADHRQQLMKDIRTAIAAVRHFESRVRDRREGEGFVFELDRLEREVSEV
jgi:hypothetical protein